MMRIELAPDLMRALNKPIDFVYPKPSAEAIEAIKQGIATCRIDADKNMITANCYYHDNHPGTQKNMLTREAVLIHLKQIAKLLLPDYGLILFDIFRTLTTQAAIFEMMRQQVEHQHPNWSASKIYHYTKKFASDPNDSERKDGSAPVHNTGGAVDLAIYHIQSKQSCPFGSSFDEVSDTSATAFFESDYDPSFEISEADWQMYRNNRRILYHLMVNAGFTNLQSEWWHYDLGDALWANEFGIDWIFDSME